MWLEMSLRYRCSLEEQQGEAGAAMGVVLMLDEQAEYEIIVLILNM